MQLQKRGPNLYKTYCVGKEKPTVVSVFDWIHPRSAIKVDDLVFWSYKSCRLKEESILVIVFYKESSWISKSRLYV